MSKPYDVAVVGAGVLGLAHAYALARRGKRVVVLERDSRAQGASVRNFGMLWPIGQPLGSLYQLACASRERWLEILQRSKAWYNPCGSLHLAYHDDEWQVIQEFHAQAMAQGIDVSLLTPGAIGKKYPAVVQEQLRGALWSPTEINVDAQQVISTLPGFLHETWGVDFVWNCRVLGFDKSQVQTTLRNFQAERIVICTGHDFRDLLPHAFAGSGIVPCKLQMMRTQAYGTAFQVGTMLAAGLTLRHYSSFQQCPTLPRLIERLDRELPEYHRFGIHVLVSQNSLGEVILGDSHEYGNDIEPFDKSIIDTLVLRYLHSMVHLPDMQIAARWHGIYAKHPQKAYVVVQPNESVLAVTGTGGAGMTLSMGLAEKLVSHWLGESHD